MYYELSFLFEIVIHIYIPHVGAREPMLAQTDDGTDTRVMYSTKLSWIFIRTVILSL